MAIASRHLKIGDHDIKLPAIKSRSGFFTVRGPFALESFVAESDKSSLTGCRFIINDESAIDSSHDCHLVAVGRFLSRRIAAAINAELIARPLSLNSSCRVTLSSMGFFPRVR
jgi:hypothetical protein